MMQENQNVYCSKAKVGKPAPDFTMFTTADSVDETLRVLEALQTGGLCPADWKPGQKTLDAGG